MATAVETVEGAVRAGIKGYVCVTGVHGVMEAHRDPAFRDLLNRAFLVTPDGMPTVWIGRQQGHVRMGRVFGPDLMIAVCSRANRNGIRHFFYGGQEGVADQLAENLQRRFPEISIAGTFTPPFRPLEQPELVELAAHIEKLNPDIIWVGLSTPKQERFMAANFRMLPCKLMIGVGAAFDLHSGHLRDAPQWVKNSGLQWLHRLWQEPGRLWKRYLVNNSTFLATLGLQFFGLRDYPLPPDLPDSPLTDNPLPDNLLSS
jgi:N-acetylglucosaminyldiphosphoundecaprenol N-acetyl-beta-D-mannosaminyltransferase